MRIFRSIVAAVLALVLLLFVLWRYEKIAAFQTFANSLFEKFDRKRGEVEEILTPGPAAPQGGDVSQTPTDPDSDFSDYNPSAPVDVGLEEAILAGVMAMQSEIDLKSYAITRTELSVAMANIIYSTPELFYLSASYSYSSGSDGRVSMLKPTYTHTPNEVVTMRAAYDAVLAEIVAGAPTAGSDFDKILYLHDYFVRNYSYDRTLTIRDAYTFFTEKTGVCQAYMLGLIAAAEALGIESLPVTSDAMKHAWNLVQIDGAWYHVDITWDDLNTLPTRVSYRYFLQSDAGLAAIDAGKGDAERHRDWTASVPASDSTYDSALFHKANTGMVIYQGVYYVAVKEEPSANGVRGTIYYGTEPTALSKLTDITGGVFTAGAGKYYPDCYCDLLLVDSVLYYHSGNSVGYVDLSAGAPQYRVLFPSGLGEGESIYGFLGIEEDCLKLVVATSPAAQDYRILLLQIP